MKIRVFLIITVLLFLSCFVFTCSDSNDYEDVEVSIISTTTENRSIPHEPDYTTWAVIQYAVENMGTKTINGWAVGFNITFQNGPQLRTSHNVYFTLESGKTSSTQTTSILIPSNYQKATGAVLNYIETW